jgi:glycosyltransferase involved in cell wall biosynthesis
VEVVRNAPDDPGEPSYVETVGHPPKVIFAGWIDAGRGLPQLLDLAAAGDIELIVVGEGDEAIRRRASATANVEVRAFAEHAEVLRLTKRADFVAAFYDPARLINLYAASNKVAEALAVGRPLLINTELLVAAPLVSAGAAFAVPYAGICELRSVFREIALHPARYHAAARAAREQFVQFYGADQTQRAALNALTKGGIALEQ